ncbi:MAG: NUDIX pyrophosphatase [Fidelibacterota bacterium]
MSKIKVRVVDAYVFRKTGDGIRFLLLKRAKTKIYEHLWQGVAGKIEAGEQAWEAAVRELKEETGLEPVLLFVADHVSKFYEAHQDRINLVPVFGIQVDSEHVILSEEHCDFRWVSFQEARKTLVWSGQKKGLSAVYDMAQSGDDRMRWSQINTYKTRED